MREPWFDKDARPAPGIAPQPQRDGRPMISEWRRNRRFTPDGWAAGRVGRDESGWFWSSVLWRDGSEAGRRGGDAPDEETARHRSDAVNRLWYTLPAAPSPPQPLTDPDEAREEIARILDLYAADHEGPRDLDCAIDAILAAVGDPRATCPLDEYHCGDSRCNVHHRECNQDGSQAADLRARGKPVQSPDVGEVLDVLRDASDALARQLTALHDRLTRARATVEQLANERDLAQRHSEDRERIARERDRYAKHLALHARADASEEPHRAHLNDLTLDMHDDPPFILQRAVILIERLRADLARRDAPVPYPPMFAEALGEAIARDRAGQLRVGDLVRITALRDGGLEFAIEPVSAPVAAPTDTPTPITPLGPDPDLERIRDQRIREGR